jgi:hypothetical protein
LEPMRPSWERQLSDTSLKEETVNETFN